MIDVIIPAYNAHKTIERTLYSIAYQNIADKLNVYIVNDKSEKDYKEQVEFFSTFLNVKELVLSKNSGPGVARQYGIDNSNSKYIIFIDSDDVFSSPSAIKILYDKIDNENLDVVTSSFYEQREDFNYIEKIDDPIWLHGKIYRRSFLVDNNIRFNNTSANEDNGFNQLVFLKDSLCATISDFTYIWCYNENSITRRNNRRYMFSGLKGYIYNMTWALERAIQDNCDYEKISVLSYCVILAIYYHYIEYYDEKNVDDILKESKKIKKIYEDYPILDLNHKREILNGQFMFLMETFNEDTMINPKISFDEFLRKIEVI